MLPVTVRQFNVKSGLFGPVACAEWQGLSCWESSWLELLLGCGFFLDVLVEKKVSYKRNLRPHNVSREGNMLQPNLMMAMRQSWNSELSISKTIVSWTIGSSST